MKTKLRSLDDFSTLTTMWQIKRDFFNPEYIDATRKGQFIKLAEEMGELAGNMARGKSDGVVDDIGDMMVVLNGLAKLHGTTLLNCANHAYNEIKDRRGKMINGVYVKESDL